MYRTLTINFFLFFIMVVCCQADNTPTPLADFSPEKVSVLNDQLSNYNQRINTLEELENIFQAGNILPVANGGTGGNFSGGLQGAIFYFSGTGVISTLNTGVAGQFLETQGANANPVWGDVPAQALRLKSTTTVSGAASTGNITLSSGMAYKVVVKGAVATNSDQLYLRFNSDSGANYSFFRSGYFNSGGVGNQNWSIPAVTNEIMLSSTIGMTGNGEFELEMNFMPSYLSAHDITVEATLRFNEQGAVSSMTKIVGTYAGASDVTSFVLLASTGNISTTVWTYEYSGT